jgi:predicted lysophospholipase L1 biosynthesis ABC-type transport system permease subunit
MITAKVLFKTYNLKTWRQNKFQIFLSIFAIAIAVAILISLRSIIFFNGQYTISNSRSLNDGDINITLPSNTISEEQYKLLDKLKAEDKLYYATTYKMQNNFNHNYMNSVVDVKIIDSDYYSVDERVGRYKDKLGSKSILINRTLADKFSLKKGDSISITLKNFSQEECEVKISDVIDTTNMVDENIFGLMIFNKADIPVHKGFDVNNLATNVNISVNKNFSISDIEGELEKSFKAGAKFSTSEQLIKSTKELRDREEKALGLIEMIVTLITGAGIGVTICILTLKRKKDYVLLAIYGMDDKLLKNVILYETFIIAVIGNVIGIVLSIMITGVIERNIFRELRVVSIVAGLLLAILVTFVFTMLQTLTFTILPIYISKRINLNSILRQEVEKLKLDENLASIGLIMLIMLVISISIYIGSLNLGGMYTIGLLIITAAFYIISFVIIGTIKKIKFIKNKTFVLAFRNIERQKLKFSACATALILTLVLCGTIINLAYYIIPKAITEFSEDNGYNLTLNTSIDESNIAYTEETLNKEKEVLGYVKDIVTNVKLMDLNGKRLQDIVENSRRYPEVKTALLENYNNTKFNAIDISKSLIKHKPLIGRWLDSKDINNNYIVLGNNFASENFMVGDKVSVDIQGKRLDFTILGIMDKSQFGDDWGAYVDIASLKGAGTLDETNSKLNYLIKCNSKDEKNLNYSLSKKLKGAVIISEKDKYNSLTALLQQMTYAFICISCISIFSSFCLVANILIMVNFDRIKEFLVLNILGAKIRDIKKISIIEGLITGGLAGVIGILSAEALNFIITTYGFDSRYSPSYKMDLAMFAVAILVVVVSSLSVISSMELEKHSSLLRVD